MVMFQNATPLMTMDIPAVDVMDLLNGQLNGRDLRNTLAGMALMVHSFVKSPHTSTVFLGQSTHFRESLFGTRNPITEEFGHCRHGSLRHPGL